MGKIVSVQVVYEIETDEGTEAKAINLTAMRRHCRPERVDDLLDDLQVLCEDIQESREGARVR
jgi:hypothetical protein